MVVRSLLMVSVFMVLCGCGDQEIDSGADAQQSAESTDAVNQDAPNSDVSSDTAVGSVSLEQRVDEMILVLEAEKHDEFVRKFMDPQEVLKADEAGKLDVVIRSFGERGATELLDGLKSIKGQEPTFNEDMTIVWFTSDVRVASSNDLAFVKVGEDWYIPNKSPKRPSN